MTLPLTRISPLWVALLSVAAPLLLPSASRGDAPPPDPAAQPRVAVTVALIAGKPPVEVQAQQVDSPTDGVTVVRVTPQAAEAWIRPATTASLLYYNQQVRLSTLSQTLFYSYAAPARGGAPASAATASNSAGGPGASAAQLAGEAGSGLALKTADAELVTAAEQVLELSWPDDKPRYYLDRVETGLYRRVWMADREGYVASLRPRQVGADCVVDLDLTRRILAGGRLDETIGAMVGKPSLFRTSCVTTVVVTPDAATVLFWQAPASARGASPTGLPGLAVVLRLAGPSTAPPAGEPGGEGEAMALTTPAALADSFTVGYGGGGAGGLAPAVGAPAAVPETRVQGTPGGRTRGAPGGPPTTPVTQPPAVGRLFAGHGTPIRVEATVVEALYGSLQGPALQSAPDAAKALEALIAQGKARVVASSVTVARENQTAVLSLEELGQGVEFPAEAAASGEAAPADPAAARQDASLPTPSPATTGPVPPASGGSPGLLPLQREIAVTPRLLADGNVSLALELRLDEPLSKVDRSGDEAAAIGTRSATVRLQIPDGGAGLVHGLVGLRRPVEGTGQTFAQPFETLILIKPSIVRDDEPGLRTMDRVGVNVRYQDGLDEARVAALADVVSTAAKALAGTFPEQPLAGIRLLVTPGREWHESTVTDRQSGIYVRVGPQGIGEHVRADAGPVALLCEAVADLHNTRRLPGLNRFIAHRYLVPAVTEALGPDPLPSVHKRPLGPDGPEVLRVITDDNYTTVHPDMAAVAALKAVDEKLGLEGLRGLLDALPRTPEDPFTPFREAALRASPDLASAFRAYDRATRLEPDEEGSCLIASFEADETIMEAQVPPVRTAIESLLLTPAVGAKWSLTDEQATHGSYSLKLEADQNMPWMHLILDDPDWKFGDWRRFSEFSLDLRIDALGPQQIWISAHDHPTCGHRMAYLFSDALQPGQWHHLSCSLDQGRLQDERDMDAEFSAGPFRADSVSRLYIGLGKLEQPVTLYLDNLRLTPRQATGQPRPR